MEAKLEVYICTAPNDSLTRDIVSKALQGHPLVQPWIQEDAPASVLSTPQLRMGKVHECDIFLLVVADQFTHEMEDELQEALRRGKDILVFIQERYSETPHAKLVQDLAAGHVQRWVRQSDLNEAATRSIAALITQRFRENTETLFVSVDDPANPHIDSFVPERLIGRRKDLQRLTEWVNSNNSGHLLVQGNPGVGKTALLASFARDTRAVRVTVSSLMSGKPHLVLAALIEQVAVRVRRALTLRGKHTAVELSYQLNELLLMARTSSSKLVVVVDGIDQAAEVESNTRFGTFLPDPPPENVLLILSTNNPVEDGRPHWERFSVEPLSPPAVAEYLDTLSIPEAERKRVSRAARGYPLFLELLRRDIPGGPVPRVSSVDEYLNSIWTRYTGMSYRFLTLLAVNKGPVSVDLACAFLECDRQALERALSGIRAFLAYEGEQFYLFHGLLVSSLRKFLTKRTIQEAHIRLAQVISTDSSLPQWDVPYHLLEAAEYGQVLEVVTPDYLRRLVETPARLDQIRAVVGYAYRSALKLHQPEVAVKHAVLYSVLISEAYGGFPNAVLAQIARSGDAAKALQLLRRRSDSSALAEGYVTIAKALPDSDMPLKQSLLEQAVTLCLRVQPETRDKVFSEAAPELMRIDPQLALPIIKQRVQEKGAEDWSILFDLVPPDAKTALQMLELLETKRMQALYLAFSAAQVFISPDDFKEAYSRLETESSRSIPLLVYLLTHSRHIPPPITQWIKAELTTLIENRYRRSWPRVVRLVLRNLAHTQGLLSFSQADWLWESVQTGAWRDRAEILSYLLRVTGARGVPSNRWMLDEINALVGKHSLASAEEALSAARLAVSIATIDAKLGDSLMWEAMTTIERIGNQKASLSENYLVPIAQELLSVDPVASLMIAEKCQYIWQIGGLYGQLLSRFFTEPILVELNKESARKVLDATVWVQRFGTDLHLFAGFIHKIASQRRRTSQELAPFAVEALVWSRLSPTAVSAVCELAKNVFLEDQDLCAHLLQLVSTASERLPGQDQARCFFSIAEILGKEPKLASAAEGMISRGLQILFQAEPESTYHLMRCEIGLVPEKAEGFAELIPEVVERLYSDAKRLSHPGEYAAILADLSLLCARSSLWAQERLLVEESLSVIRTGTLQFLYPEVYRTLALAERKRELSSAVSIVRLVPNLNVRRGLLEDLIDEELLDSSLRNRPERLAALVKAADGQELARSLTERLAQEKDKKALTLPEIHALVQDLLPWVESAFTHTGFRAAAIADLGQLLFRVDPSRATRLLHDSLELAKSIENASDRSVCTVIVGEALSIADKQLAQRVLLEARNFVTAIEVVEERIARSISLADALRKVGNKSASRQVLGQALSACVLIEDPRRRTTYLAHLLASLAHIDPGAIDRLVEEACPDETSRLIVYSSLTRNGPVQHARSFLRKLKGTQLENHAFHAYVDRLQAQKDDLRFDLTLLDQARNLGVHSTLNILASLLAPTMKPDRYYALVGSIREQIQLGLDLTHSDSFVGVLDALQQASDSGEVASTLGALLPEQWRIDHAQSLLTEEVSADLLNHWGSEGVGELTCLCNRVESDRLGIPRSRVLVVQVENEEAPPLPNLVVGPEKVIYIQASPTPEAALQGIALSQPFSSHITDNFVERFIRGSTFNGRHIAATPVP